MSSHTIQTMLGCLGDSAGLSFAAHSRKARQRKRRVFFMCGCFCFLEDQPLHTAGYFYFTQMQCRLPHRFHAEKSVGNLRKNLRCICVKNIVYPLIPCESFSKPKPYSSVPLGRTFAPSRLVKLSPRSARAVSANLSSSCTTSGYFCCTS